MAEQANYQGEHLGLSLNRDAVFALEDALARLRSSFHDDAAAHVPLRLPDGRTLQLRMSLTDVGVIRDAHGDYLDDDGVAHGDVTGDLDRHYEARQVLDAAVRPHLAWELTSPQRDGIDQVDVDHLARTRVDAAIEALPYRYSRPDDWTGRLRTRALDAAREALPRLLDEDRESRRRAQSAQALHGLPTDSPSPLLSPNGPAVIDRSAEGAERYAYRGATLDGGELVERLIADGLAAPAARDMPVDEVVFQVGEANSVDLDDLVDRHDFPRRIDPADPVDEQHHEDLRPVDAGRGQVRLRNRSDDHRREAVEHARMLRGWARDDVAAEQLDTAATWTRQAQDWDELAQADRADAIAHDHEDRGADPDGYADRLAATRDTGRTAGSDGRASGAGMAM